MNPLGGSWTPAGGSNLKGFPLVSISESVMGLNDNCPAKAIAVTISGDERKFIVLL